MSFLMYAIAMAAMEIIPATMGLLFYFFLFRLILPPKPRELRANEHIYHPLRIYVPVLKFILEYIAFIGVTVSFRLWLYSDWEQGRSIAIYFLTYGLVVLFLPSEKKVKRVIVNAEGITLEYRMGGTTHYAPKQYVGSEGKNLYFETPGGIRKTVKLRFLRREDRDAVARDLNVLRQTGNLDGVVASSAEEARSKANLQFLEEKQKLYADTRRYEAYLKEEAAKRLSSSQKQDLVRMIQLGDKMNAIKKCREWTGLGLREAKDMVEQYRKCLLEKEETVDASAEVSISKNSMDRLKTEAEMVDQREGTTVKEKEFLWKWRITDREQEFSEQKSLESTMDQLLSDLSMRREESVALIPPSPLLGIACVRASLDPQGIMYRTEVEYVEHDAQGNPKILYKDGLMSWDVRDVFVCFRRSAKVQTEGWQQLRTK